MLEVPDNLATFGQNTFKPTVLKGNCDRSLQTVGRAGQEFKWE